MRFGDVQDTRKKGNNTESRTDSPLSFEKKMRLISAFKNGHRFANICGTVVMI